MAKEKSPAFQFYPKDFLSSDGVALMNNEQIGAYVLLLCHAWLTTGGLPESTADLARLARCPERRFTERVWPQIQGSFYWFDGYWYNQRLETERLKQEAFRAERSASGRRGAAKKYGWLSDGSATKEPVAKSSSSFSSSSAVSSTPPNPPHGGGRITRADRKRAEEARHAIGGCPHGVEHSFEACIRQMVADAKVSA